MITILWLFHLRQADLEKTELFSSESKAADINLNVMSKARSTIDVCGNFAIRSVAIGSLKHIVIVDIVSPHLDDTLYPSFGHLADKLSL